jgi:hypothetical protein
VNAVDRVPASIAPDLVTTYAEVTIARDDVWLEANHATVEAQYEAWLMDHAGVSTASSGSSHAGM